MFLNRIFVKHGPPIHLVWFITARCNLTCSHCFNRSGPVSADVELRFDEISKIIQSLPHLLSVTLTGGEPFMRDDLLEIVKLLFRKKLTRNVLIATNGFYRDNILTITEKILRTRSEANIFIVVSIDGDEITHDKYRNQHSSYKNAIDTIKGLKRLKNEFLNLQIGVNTTLHKGNQYIINNLIKDIYSKFDIIPSITLIRGNSRLPELKEVDIDIYGKIIKQITFLRSLPKHKRPFQIFYDTREILGHRLSYRTLVERKRDYYCYAGSLLGVIYETGDLYPCEMLKEAKLGNLRDYSYDINKLWQTDRADKFRAIIKKKSCYCTYECQFTCNTLYNIKYLSFYLLSFFRYMRPTILR
jgi:MoaA/NifB/PqqE/SkfB family radical SAM enzyme